MTSAPPIVLWMQSLSDQTRGRLLRLVERVELTVVELCAVLQLPQSTVSRHLKVLADDGWLLSRRDGTSNLYKMAGDKLEANRRSLWHLVREQAITDSVIAQDDSRLEQVIADRRSKSQAFFSGAAGHWDRMKMELFGKRIDTWAMAAMLSPNQIVGDLGCGTGGIANVIAPWVSRVIGVDSSAAMLDSARDRLKDRENVELRRGELTAMPLKNEELTTALLVLVLPYAESPRAVFAEAARATHRGGRLIVVDVKAHARQEYRDELGHTWLGFEREQMNDWLHEAGWKVERYVDLPPDPEAKGPGLFALNAVR